MKKSKNQGIVFSTDQGRMCPECEQQINKCTCRQNQDLPETDGIVRVGRETKGRKGKGVTLITGLPLNTVDLKKLAKKLKQKCGAGGSLKGNTIEIQGDFRDQIVEELKKLDYSVKKTGG